jgi:hypothetical protein
MSTIDNETGLPPVAEVLEFSCEREQVPLKITTESGEVLELVMWEMTGTERDQYLGSLSKRMDAKSRSITDFNALEGSLVQRCLKTRDGETLKLATIQGWPSRMLKSLFERCQKLNALDIDAEGDAKNA